MTAELASDSFPHRALTTGALICPVLRARRYGPPRNQSREVGRGHHLHSRDRGAVRSLALGRVGAFPPGGGVVSGAYIVSGLLALGLCGYLLYAMFKPEKF